MAIIIAFSISSIFSLLTFPAKGPLISKDLSIVVTCSHLAIDAFDKPPSPSWNKTWVGDGLRFVDKGTTTISLAKLFRISKETTKAGRFLISLGFEGRLTKYISPLFGCSIIPCPFCTFCRYLCPFFIFLLLFFGKG